MGIDVGGSHITCQLFDLEKNVSIPSSRKRISLDSAGSADAIIDGWVEAIRQTAENQGILNLEGIGFAMPGPFDYLNGIALFKGVLKFESLYGINIKTELETRLNLPDDFKIRFLNDASCFAVGETWLGEVKDYKRVIALTLGTGFGTTFIKSGLPVAGIHGIPDDGFLYHIPFKNSIADDYFSTRWFINEYKKKTGVTVSGVKALVELTDRDKIAKGLFYEFGINLGMFLNPWINQFEANAIVIGGNISKSFKLFQNNLKTQLSSVVIKISQLEENAALAGSARLCDNTFYEKLLTTNIIK